ncbi:DMT family transporter [Saccharopolyspora sp. WRP15-2]|uniref:DMT family transporter n=1 Tax=Saccharopolyspora oryzae TaxID=2997343 RepID=A0ABT4URJ1_9PSEU|nr:DMT family transporter [Saccharopolyspora oryzae]MDA3624312.1 DMT family transporter [Saccharopolyspora oryzae]
MKTARSIPLSLAAPIVFIWASGFPTGKLGVAAAPPFLLTTVRLAMAAALLAVIATASHADWPRGRQLGHAAASGILTYGAQFGGCYGGMSVGVPASVTALVIAMNPVLTAALAAVLLRERLSRVRLAGLVVGVLAVVVTLGGQVLAEGTLNPGILLTLVGLLGFSAGGLYQQRFCGPIDPRAGGAVQSAAAAAAVGVLALFENGHVTHWVQAAAVLAWLVLAGSVIGISCYLRAVGVGGASRASALFSAVPPVAALLAWPLLGETPTIATALGIALGAASCVLGTRPDRAAPVRPRERRVRQPIDS